MEILNVIISDRMSLREDAAVLCSRFGFCPSFLLAVFFLPHDSDLSPARTVVAQNSRGRIVDVATLPAAVRHPVILDHLRLSRIIFLKDFSVQQAFLGERSAVCVSCTETCEFFIGIALLCVLLQIVDHGMSDCI